MGWVWEAVCIATDERVALKFLKGAKEEDRRRFLREVRAAAAIQHPNVIAVHEAFELADGTLVMVMDLLEGETLGAVLKREGRIGLPALAAIVLPVIAALEAAHGAGIVHRDLKPDNIFLARHATKNVTVKVLDFGVAKLTASEGLAARTQALTGTGTMVGTPYYMAPEQVVSEKDLDARADLWSLGVVMYECLSGVRPTEADNIGRVLKRILRAEFEPIRSHCDDLPDDVASLVSRMLTGDREKRTRELKDVADVLARYADASIPAFVGPAGTGSADALADTVASVSQPPLTRAEPKAPVARTPPGSTPPPVSRARTRIRAALVVAALVLVVAGSWQLGFARKGPISPSAHTAEPSVNPSSAKPLSR
jgi:eukaryotic-like serine/threonine-protein kinase